MATYLCDDGNAEVEIKADSASEAADLYVDGGDWNTEDGTVWVTVYVQEVDVEGNEVGEREGITVTLDPDEPQCAEGLEHDWIAPQWLVGGIAENPGVWGHGGGGVSTVACRHCGCKRVVDTWAQDPETGCQGLTSTRYEANAFAAEFSERGASAANASDLLSEEEALEHVEGHGQLYATAFTERMARRREKEGPCECGCTSTGEGPSAVCDGECSDYTEPSYGACSECGCSQSANGG